MICVHDGRRIFQIPLLIHLEKSNKVFIVIVRNACSVLVHTAAQDRMCIWISVCCHIISSVNEIVPCLCCHNRVQHHRKVTARRVFHTDRNIHSTRCQSVLLVFHGAGANCFIRENIVQVASVFRIEHLIGTCKTIVRITRRCILRIAMIPP